MARSITRKPRKFSFSSQTKYSPSIITYAQGVNSYLEFFFRQVRRATFRQFRRFIVQSESAESVEIFKYWRFLIFLYWSLKGTVLIRQITNNECLRNLATKISQFLSILVSRAPCCYPQSKKLVWFNFSLFCTLGTSCNRNKYQEKRKKNYNWTNRFTTIY